MSHCSIKPHFNFIEYLYLKKLKYYIPFRSRGRQKTGSSTQKRNACNKDMHKQQSNPPKRRNLLDNQVDEAKMHVRRSPRNRVVFKNPFLETVYLYDGRISLLQDTIAKHRTTKHKKNIQQEGKHSIQPDTAQ